MVEVRVSRQNVEALADEGVIAGVTRIDSQYAQQFDGADEARVSRQAIEVLAEEPLIASVTRIDSQYAQQFDAAEEVRVSRQAIEILASPDAACSVTRIDSQYAQQFDGGGDEVRVSRFTMECLARQGSAGPVVPLALADDAHIFLHNWATQARMKTSFRTDIVASPDSGAESRRGLSLKPFRSMDLLWTIADPDSVTGVGSLEELERLEVLLRRMTNARFQVPIYMDQKELTASYLSTDDTILLPTRQGRFFPGARIAIVQLDYCHQPTSFSWHTIDSMTNDSLTLSATLGEAVPAGSLVFPIMDCEVALEVQADYATARVPNVRLTVTEAPGASQLPPLKSDTPNNAELAHDDRPIWFEEPDWTSGVGKGRSRQGTRDNSGRADYVNLEGDRSRQTHRFQITGNRDTIWDALEFFETRRGRLRSFWHIDQDQYMLPADIDTAGGTFVSISEETLDLADIQEEFDAVGVVMADGKHYVTDVNTVQDILTVYRITVGDALPTGLELADVHRIARARLVRFKSDEFTETWTHTGYGTAGIDIIEVLNETDFEV